MKIRLKSEFSSFAKKNSCFWIVRPEVGIANITGLSTILAGPHVEVLPGSGPSERQLIGLENTPLATQPNVLNLVLLSHRLEAVKPVSPIYYHGFEVSRVNFCQLSSDALMVETHIFIRPRFTNLVRSDSMLWNVSGFDASLGFFHGAKINVESLQSLVMGGIAFATPPEPKTNAVKDGSLFTLSEEPKSEWLTWNPAIPLQNKR